MWVQYMLEPPSQASRAGTHAALCTVYAHAMPQRKGQVTALRSGSKHDVRHSKLIGLKCAPHSICVCIISSDVTASHYALYVICMLCLKERVRCNSTISTSAFMQLWWLNSIRCIIQQFRKWYAFVYSVDSFCKQWRQCQLSKLYMYILACTSSV
jgi:hypothetical protein